MNDDGPVGTKLPLDQRGCDSLRGIFRITYSNPDSLWSTIANKTTNILKFPNRKPIGAQDLREVLKEHSNHKESLVMEELLVCYAT